VRGLGPRTHEARLCQAKQWWMLDSSQNGDGPMIMWLCFRQGIGRGESVNGSIRRLHAANC
jgi:hypothetical protein